MHTTSLHVLASITWLPGPDDQNLTVRLRESGGCIDALITKFEANAHFITNGEWAMEYSITAYVRIPKKDGNLGKVVKRSVTKYSHPEFFRDYVEPLKPTGKPVLQ